VWYRASGVSRLLESKTQRAEWRQRSRKQYVGIKYSTAGYWAPKAAVQSRAGKSWIKSGHGTEGAQETMESGVKRSLLRRVTRLGYRQRRRSDLLRGAPTVRQQRALKRALAAECIGTGWGQSDDDQLQWEPEDLFCGRTDCDMRKGFKRCCKGW